jgi:simple sugar transport system permease protein
VVVLQSVQGALYRGLYLWYLLFGILALALIWLVIYKTPFGFRLRACDKESEALISLGINPGFYQICAILISGVFCAVGGSFLSLNLGAFVPGMSAGKGWIALVVIFLGGRKPQGILAAAFVFGLAEAFSIYAQGFWNIPADFILAFPYICTLIAMIAVSASTPQAQKL